MCAFFRTSNLRGSHPFWIGLATIVISASSLFSQTTASRVATEAGQPIAQGGTATIASLDIFRLGVLTADAYGNLYVGTRNSIFKFDASEIPTRVAGGVRDWRYSGDGVPALGAGVN